MSPWLSATRVSLVLLLSLVTIKGLVVLSSDAQATARDALPLLGGEQDLYLEVFVNGAPIGKIGAFRLRNDGRMASEGKELAELGITARASASADGLIELDRLECLAYDYDAITQSILFTATDDCRSLNSYLAQSAEAEYPLADTSGRGAVVNYTLFATSNTDTQDFWGLDDQDAAFSGAVDAWIYGTWGTLSQTATASTSTSDLYDSVRLDTRWTYSDQATLTTFRAGDVISGGLAWTRPVRLGGLQVQRDFALRPDLITMPVPTLAGSAAVPSTIDVYTNNVLVFSKDVPAGPFEVSGVPVVTGAGLAQLVVHDSLGRDTVMTVPFYATPSLLRDGLHDYSLEAGVPRRSYGVLSNDYDDRPFISGTFRYGLSDWLTLETHAEAGEELINAGAGFVVPVSYFGVASVAAAGSGADDGAGLQLAGGIELRLGPVAFHGRGQQLIGDYADIALVSAEWRDELRFHHAEPPETVVQGALSVIFPFDPTTLTVSYTRLDYQDDEQEIIGAALTRPIFESASLVMSASLVTGDEEGGLFYLGLSAPLSPGVSSSASVSARSGEIAGGVEVAKSESLSPGSYGWRVREREGSSPDRLLAASYRGSAARVEGRVQQFGDMVTASAQLDGAVAFVDGSAYVSSTISDAFAVVDAGAADVEVFHENRPVGRTNGDGRLLVANLNPYQANALSIDPRSLPIDAEIPRTKDVLVPGARHGATAKFGVSAATTSALLVLTSPEGKPLPPGLQARLAGQDESFVVGYDGEVFVHGLADQNILVADLPDGGTCGAQFPYLPQPGTQVVIQLVCQ